MKYIKSILKQYLGILFAMFFFYANAQNPFIENKGQLPKQVISKTILPSGALFFEKSKLTYVFYNGRHLADIHDGVSVDRLINAHAYSVSFLGANPSPVTELIDQSRFYENYFLGDKTKWATEVRSYKQHIQKKVYEGIDLIYTVNNDRLKYEFIVAKDNNPEEIRMRYKGLDDLFIKDGQLVLKTIVNTIVEHRPYAYQIIDNKEVEVVCNYSLKRNTVSFTFPQGYNTDYDLVIDPILEFSTYSGSTADNFGYTATYDELGFLYSGSTAFSVGYPTTLGAYQLNYANPSGGTDVAITKYDTSGTLRVYSTYLGGTKDELPHSMIVNNADELFIFGTTASDNFPVTSNAYQTTFNGGTAVSVTGVGAGFPNGSDLFVSQLSTDGGTLLASTFIGGSGNDGLNVASRLRFNYADEVRGEIDIDNNNNIYITTCTQSTDFPIVNGFQGATNGSQEGCIVKMDNQLSSIVWSSYLGGTNDDAIYSLALDDNDNVYVTGGTNSVDFPTTFNAYQTIYQDSLKADAFITLIAADGSQILSSSYYGSDQYDQSYFVEVGGTEEVYLFGQTKAPSQTLVNNATYFDSGAGQFIAVFSKELDTISRATVVGTGNGTPDISPTAFLVDVCNKIYLSGWGSGTAGGPLSTLNLPVTSNAFQSTTDGNDFYLMVLDESLGSLIYATYFGGSQSAEHVDGGTSRFDKKGVIYQSVCAGCGGNSDFPIEPLGAVSDSNNSSNCNNGVFKFNFDFPMVIADFSAAWVSCDTSVSFQNLSNSNLPVTYQWDFGDATTSNLEDPIHNYNQAGSYTVTLIASSPGACNVSDTIIRQVYILANKKDTLTSISKCEDDQIQIGLLPINDPTITYLWSPSTNLNNINAPNPFCSSPTNTNYQLLISNGSCTDTLLQEVIIKEFLLDAGEDTSYCNTPVLLTAQFSSDVTSVVWSSNSNFSDTISLSPSISVGHIAVFYVKVTDGFCEEVDSVEVKMENINFEITGNQGLCIGDSLYLAVDNLIPTVPLISYDWSPTPLFYINDSSSIIDYIDSSMWYSVIGINADGCIMKDSVFVNRYDNPVIDSLWLDRDTIFRGETTHLNIKTPNSFNWVDLNTVADRVALTPTNDQCYYVEVFNTYDCLISDSICIKVLDVFCNFSNIKVPTAFSPNQDFINDTYFIEDKTGIISEFRLEIFNRLGQKVFETTNKYEHWDGVFRGVKLNPQVFDFYLELGCVDNRSLFKKGNITLIQ